MTLTNGEPPPAITGNVKRLITFMHDMGPGLLLDLDAVTQYVEKAESGELRQIARTADGMYDLFAAWNWFYRHSPVYLQAELQAKRLAREQTGFVPERRPFGLCCAVRHALSPQRVLTYPLQCRLTMRATLNTSSMRPGTRLRWFLPFPLSTDTQWGIRLRRASPPWLAESLLTDGGYFYGADHEIEKDGNQLTVEYTCDLTTHESHSHGFSLPDTRLEPSLSADAAVSFTRAYRGDYYQKAWLIYDWLQSVAEYEKINTRCVCNECSMQHFLAQPRTHCIGLSHVFVHLCNQAGVTARPVRGLMFTYPTDRSGRQFGYSYSGIPVIGHTWAEVYIPSTGWIPIEFEAIYYKAISETTCRVTDLRTKLKADYWFYRNIYFGNLDNQHIIFSRSSIYMPYVLRFVPSNAKGDQWMPIDPEKLRFTVSIEI